MTTPQKPKTRNFVAKNARNMTGAGAHQDKKGKKSNRARQKNAWKKEINEKNSMLHSIDESIREYDPFETALMEVEKEFNISLKEGVDEWRQEHDDSGEPPTDNRGNETYDDDDIEQREMDAERDARHDEYYGEEEEDGDFTTQQYDDMKKLIKQYKSKSDLSREDIANDLEMLEYRPTEIPNMVRYITHFQAS